MSDIATTVRPDGKASGTGKKISVNDANAQLNPNERKRAITGYDLRYRIEALVRGVSKKKIKHIYTGNGAATAPGLMLLPRIPATKLFLPEEVKVILGYAAHEIEHQLVTDFGIFERIFADSEKPTRREQQVKEFWNAIEDYRIEKVCHKDYPGFRGFINETRDHSAKEFIERSESYSAADLANPYRIGSVALTWIGARLNGYVTQAPAQALSLIDPDLNAWLESWTPDMANVVTADDAYGLACRIIDELDKIRQQEEEEPQDGPEDDETSKDGQGDKSDAPKGKAPDGSSEGSEGDPEDGGDPSKSEDGEGAAGTPDTNGNPTEAEGDAEPKSAEGASGQKADDADEDGDNADADADADAGEENGSASAQKEKAGDPSGDAGTGKRPPLTIPEGSQDQAADQADLEIDSLAKEINSIDGTEAKNAKIKHDEELLDGDRKSVSQKMQAAQQQYNAIRQSLSSSSARAAGIVRRMLQSQSKSIWKGGLEAGALDMRRLVPIVNGNSNVYKERCDRKAINTALYVLVDNSGSMSGRPLAVCQETAVTLDMAVIGTPTSIEITGFTDNNQGTPILYRYRVFGQKAQAAAATLGSMQNVTLGGTPVSIPLLESWRRLSQQKEPRKIMIVVSDGGANHNDVQASREAHDLIMMQGGIVIGISIGSAAAMKQWCDNVEEINSVEDLPNALTVLVREAMKR